MRAWRPVGPQGSAVFSLLVADRLDIVTELIEPAQSRRRRRSARRSGSNTESLCAATAVGSRAPCWAPRPTYAPRSRPAASSATSSRPRSPRSCHVLVERGELAEADALLQHSGLAGAIPQVMLFNPLLFARAELRRAQGRRDAPRQSQTPVRPAALPRQRDHATRAARGARCSRSRSGPTPREEALALAYEEVDAAAEWGTPRSIGLAAHRLGLIEGGPAGEERIRAAIATLEGSPARLELAHALVDLGGIVRRRAPVEARPWLERGMDLAHACGATALAEHARTELAATGVRPRRAARTGRDALTASELRVAELAASGMTNRAIAQSLFVTQRTVETHLGHAYQKLGHSSRERLQQQLGRPG